MKERRLLIQQGKEREEAALFGRARSLAGVVTDPPATAHHHGNPAVILLNAGLVHRVGAGRLYVKIARELAANGFTTLRFDFSGIGDSMARHDTLPFAKSAILETQDAMEYLKRTRGIERFICMGGCSGALVSLQTAGVDPRVSGAVLINFQAADGDADDPEAHPDLRTRRSAHYYWTFALFDRKSWARLFTGRSDYGKLIRAFRYRVQRWLAPAQKTPAAASPLEADLQRLAQRRVQLAFLCSDGDPLLDDLREAGGEGLRQLCSSGKVVLEVIPRSDHTFSSLDDQNRLMMAVVERVKAIRNASIGVLQAAPGRGSVLLPWRDRVTESVGSVRNFAKGEEL